MAKIGKYIYGFVNEKEDRELPITGIGPFKRPVELIHYKEICAAVSDAPIIEYDPTREIMMTHQKIIDLLMKDYTVIPFRFGTISKSKKEILDMIEQHYDAFLELMNKIEGKLELGLKVYWKKDVFADDVETPQIRALKEALSGKPEREIYNQKIELGKLVEQSVIEKRNAYVQEILNELTGISAEHKINDILDIKMIFNGAFLVDRQNDALFDSTVNKLYEKYQTVMDFKYTGPWAPYNFVNLSLDKR